MSDITWRNDTATLGSLVPWERNPKRISKAHAKRLLDYWHKIGQFQTVAVGPDGEVYDGHQRLSVLMAAHGKGYTLDVRRASRPLTDEERQELVIAAHVGTTGQFNWDELSGWDADALQAWGMDDELLANWRTDIAGLDAMLKAEQPAMGEDPGAQVDKAAELQAKWQTATGQLWLLDSGNGYEHRLICGDCTDSQVVARVMGGERAAFCVTSPPYPDAEMWETSAPELIKVGHDCLVILRDVLEAGAAMCWNTSDIPTGQGGVAANPARDTMAALEMGWTKRAEIVWEKGLSYLPAPWNTRRPTVPNVTHELILVFYNGERVPREKEGNLDVDALAWNRETVWKMSPAKASKENHKAPFPLELAERCVTLFSFPSDLVYEPFCGSGSVIIACERLGRRCRAVEIEPGYVAVALERWATMTGRTPVLLDQ